MLNIYDQDNGPGLSLISDQDIDDILLNLDNLEFNYMFDDKLIFQLSKDNQEYLSQKRNHFNEPDFCWYNRAMRKKVQYEKTIE